MSDRARHVETALAYATLALLSLYIPLETWVSLSQGLTSPFYIVDAIAMGLLLAGALHSLRARPRPAPGLRCAAIARSAANGWRATFGRLAELRAGGALDYGAAEMWIVASATTVSLGALAVALGLVVRADSATLTGTV